METTTVDSAFIRRAVEVADLNAVRVALYQQTDDPELAQLPTAANLDEAQRELLITKAVTWLEQNAGPVKLAEPPEGELRTLMNMATAEEMGDLEFKARRDLPAFKEFPWTADWTDGKPELPEGFKVAIVGSGFSGLAMGVQLERLGIPYVVLERRGEPGHAGGPGDTTNPPTVPPLDTVVRACSTSPNPSAGSDRPRSHRGNDQGTRPSQGSSRTNRGSISPICCAHTVIVTTGAAPDA
jgi:hypothetical protein